MKSTILTAAVVLCALAASPAHADPGSITLLLVGGAEADTISISLSPDGRTYVIDSVAPLEVGGTVCWHPTARENQLNCEAAAISSFEVNAGEGDDTVQLSGDVTVPATLRGEGGDDTLAGGAAADLLLGGVGVDRLAGNGGDDVLEGAGGHDVLRGDGGGDRLLGGGGPDLLYGGPGTDILNAGPGLDGLYGGPGNDMLIGSARDSFFGGPGRDTVNGVPR